MLEVMYAIAQARGYSIEELEQVRAEKLRNEAVLKTGYTQRKQRDNNGGSGEGKLRKQRC